MNTHDYIKTAIETYDGNIRNTARQLNISPMKLRKILITAGVFENGVSREIHNLLKKGLSIEKICDSLQMSKASVYSYLPYKHTIYNLDEKSSTAKKQERYRNRKGEKAGIDQELLEWLSDHPGIVEDLKRRSQGKKRPPTV